MALKKGDRANFDSLQRAARNGDLCIIESRCAKTGEYRALVCAVNRMDGEVQVVPLAQMILGNPYDDYVDPTMTDLPKAVRR